MYLALLALHLTDILLNCRNTEVEHARVKNAYWQPEVESSDNLSD